MKTLEYIINELELQLECTRKLLAEVRARRDQSNKNTKPAENPNNKPIQMI